MNSRIGLLLFVFLVIGLSGCAVMNGPETITNHNNSRMLSLERGMTINQVIGHIGPAPSCPTCNNVQNPLKREMYPAGEDMFDILFFYTRRLVADGAITDEETSPVVFKNGRLDGWGWLYWENTARQFNIRIRGRS